MTTPSSVPSPLWVPGGKPSHRHRSTPRVVDSGARPDPHAAAGADRTRALVDARRLRDGSHTAGARGRRLARGDHRLGQPPSGDQARRRDCCRCWCARGDPRPGAGSRNGDHRRRSTLWIRCRSWRRLDRRLRRVADHHAASGWADWWRDRRAIRPEIRLLAHLPGLSRQRAGQHHPVVWMVRTQCHGRLVAHRADRHRVRVHRRAGLRREQGCTSRRVAHLGSARRCR